MPSFDFTGGSLPGGASVARSSAGTRCNAGSVVETIGANLPRFDYASAVLRGLLLESAGTNALLYSEAIDNAAWAKSACTITANAATAPDGTTNAEKMIPSTANTAHNANNGSAAVAGVNSITVYAKAAGYNWIILQGGGYAYFDVLNGTIGNISSATASIAAIGNGWFRCVVTCPASTSGVVLWSTNANGATSFAGDGTSGACFWGAQIEAGAAPTSYIATGGTSVTRSADSLSLNWTGQGVGDGACYSRITYDDLSSSIIAGTVAGGLQTIAAAALARPWVRRIDYLAVPTVPPIRAVTLQDLA